jgi:hypothetical protein
MKEELHPADALAKRFLELLDAVGNESERFDALEATLRQLPRSYNPQAHHELAKQRDAAGVKYRALRKEFEELVRETTEKIYPRQA